MRINKRTNEYKTAIDIIEKNSSFEIDLFKERELVKKIAQRILQENGKNLLIVFKKINE